MKRRLWPDTSPHLENLESILEKNHVNILEEPLNESEENSGISGNY